MQEFNIATLRHLQPQEEEEGSNVCSAPFTGQDAITHLMREPFQNCGCVVAAEAVPVDVW